MVCLPGRFPHDLHQVPGSWSGRPSGWIVRAACTTRLIRVNARCRARVRHGSRRIPGGERAMDDAFEWVDFALQPPGLVVECLDAAGIDGSVPVLTPPEPA